MKKTEILKLCRVGLVAAIYVVISVAMTPISFGPIQCRLAEGLTMLALLEPETIPGVVLGCCLTNLIGIAMGTNPLGLIDVICGTIATGISTALVYLLRKVRAGKFPILSILAPGCINGVVIALEWCWFMKNNTPIIATTIIGEIFAGETIAIVAGYWIIEALLKRKILINQDDEIYKKERNRRI